MTFKPISFDIDHFVPADDGSGLSNTNASQLQGITISGTPPTTGQILLYNGLIWLPSNPPGGPPTGPAGGDLSGTYPNPTVVKLQNNPVSAAAPTLNQVLAWNGSQWIPTSPTNTELITISSLAPGGIWFPLEYVGPTCGMTSSANLTNYTTGVGFFQVPKTGVIHNFKYTNATPSNSTFIVQLWLAPGGDPSLFGFTGITITVLANTYIMSNSVDTLNVNEGDLLVFFNGDPAIGYTPDALTITADITITL